MLTVKHFFFGDEESNTGVSTIAGDKLCVKGGDSRLGMGVAMDSDALALEGSVTWRGDGVFELSSCRDVGFACRLLEVWFSDDFA